MIQTGRHVPHQAIIKKCAVKLYPALEHLSKLFVSGLNVCPEFNRNSATICHTKAIVLLYAVTGEHIGHAEGAVFFGINAMEK